MKKILLPVLLLFGVLSGCTKNLESTEPLEDQTRSATTITYTVIERNYIEYNLSSVTIPTPLTYLDPSIPSSAWPTGGTITLYTLANGGGVRRNFSLDASPHYFGELYIPYPDGSQACLLEDGGSLLTSYMTSNGLIVDPVFSKIYVNAEFSNDTYILNYKRYDQHNSLIGMYNGVIPKINPSRIVPSRSENRVSVYWSQGMNRWTVVANHPVISNQTIKLSGGLLTCTIPAGKSAVVTNNSNSKLFTGAPGMTFSPVSDATYYYTQGYFCGAPIIYVPNQSIISLARSGDGWLITSSLTADADIAISCDGWDALDQHYTIPKGGYSVHTGPADMGYQITNVASYGSKYTFLW